LILSYPRSGSTFVRYIIEHFTKRPTRGPPTSTNLVDSPRIEKYKNEKPVAFKIHGEDALHQEYIHAMLKRNIPLIFLMRNPMEMFPRHTGQERAYTIASEPPVPPLSADIAYFFENIKTYELYEGKKQIFYYEDLVEKPAYVIKQLCEFLNVDTNGAEQRKFMDNFEEHFENSRSAYNADQSEDSDLVFFMTLEPPGPGGQGTFVPYSRFLQRGKNASDNQKMPGLEWSPETDLDVFKFKQMRIYQGHPDVEVFDGIPELHWQFALAHDPAKRTDPQHNGILITYEMAEATAVIPTTLETKGTHSDGKTIVSYSLRLTPRQQENFWSNFKELCGSGNWDTCERYMDIEYGEEK